MARTKSDNIFLVITITLAISMTVFVFGFLVPQARDEVLAHKNKCEAAGGEVINVNSAGRRCIKPDSYINIE